MTELARICQDVEAAVDDGHYDLQGRADIGPSLARAVDAGRAIVAEVKLDAPSWDEPADRDPLSLARVYDEADVDGISVLTERDHFQGTIQRLADVATLGRPTLMKDFVLDAAQVEAARRAGASCVLLIQAVFDHDLARGGRDQLIEVAHAHDLEVMLEASTTDEFERALTSEADLLAVNSRRLDTMDVSLDRAVDVLDARDDRPTMLLSGLSEDKDIERAFQAGADGVLVGTALARADDPAEVIARWRG